MYLGLDIGTTKIAAVLADEEGRLVVDTAQDHQADLPAPPGHSEQNPERLIAIAWAMARRLPAELLADVQAVGVTGQMHGLVPLDEEGAVTGPLVTWQDQRCLEDPAWFTDLNKRLSAPLRPGYGGATLAWYAHHGGLPAGTVSACTIHDLVAARLCGRPRPATDSSGAASWGIFDPDRAEWDTGVAEAIGVPDSLLPELLPCGAILGRVILPMAWALGIPEDIPVAVAIGDNQASILATLRTPAEEVALTLGTGGQVGVVMAAGEARALARRRRKCEARPFLDDRALLVGASLCGGAAWAWLAEAVIAWQRDMGLPTPERNAVFARLNDLGAGAATSVEVRPHFLGERHDPSLRGTIARLDTSNFRLGPLARGLAIGIMRTLKDLLPEEALLGRRRLVGSGNALRRNPLLQQIARDVFDLTFVMPDCREEAALGAARLAARACKEAARIEQVARAAPPPEAQVSQIEIPGAPEKEDGSTPRSELQTPHPLLFAESSARRDTPPPPAGDGDQGPDSTVPSSPEARNRL